MLVSENEGEKTYLAARHKTQESSLAKRPLRDAQLTDAIFCWALQL